MHEKLDFHRGFDSMFEIDLVIRDSKGQPTNRRKSFKTNDAGKLWEFWMRHRGRPKRKKKEKIPTAKEANEILANMYND